MKKITKYIGLSMVFALLTSCSDFLDVQPKGTLTEDVQFKPTQGYYDAMYGVYSKMASTDLYGANLSYGFVDKIGQLFGKLNTNETDTEILKYDYQNSKVRAIIDSYTRESGVRALEKKIAKIMRRLARKIASDEAVPAVLKVDHLREYLGPVEYTRDKYQDNRYAGVVTGLAWTAVGGEILFVESSLSRGKSAKLTITGNLGDVMKESAILALEYVHSHAAQLGIEESLFENWNVHIHVPEGAIPKDGPSAGITMVTSLVSTFTRRKVKSNLAMTGEITLRGKVLPVGGIKEKILAAKRAGIREIVLCEENRKDVEEINQTYVEGLTFHYVADIMQVIDTALLDEKVKD